MKLVKIIYLLILLNLSLSVKCFAKDCESAEQLLSNLIENAELPKSNLIASFKLQIAGIGAELEEAYCRGIVENIANKQQAILSGARFSENDIERRALQYEKFRLQIYLSSGVAPKRYFGFFDKQGNTAYYEQVMHEVIRKALGILNQFSVDEKLGIHISDQELALTFLAEGGALLMTDLVDEINRVHPVRGVGLDNYRLGFKRFPKLVQIFDQQFKTKLGHLSWSVLGESILIRPMTFREAILGTAIMYLFEKEIADHKYFEIHKARLSSISLDRQFIHTSLVYNSGILFSEERVDQILNFSSAEYLQNISLKNAKSRGLLPIAFSDQAKSRLKNGKSIPQQLTSWSAVYHILQRYGAWVALRQFSDFFDSNGSFNAQFEEK